MAADPTLADRIIEWLAKYPPDDDDRIIKLNFEIGELRAAAVRLRKLDAAISNVRAEFAQALSDDTETSGFLTWIERLDTVLADALGGTE